MKRLWWLSLGFAVGCATLGVAAQQGTWVFQNNGQSLTTSTPAGTYAVTINQTGAGKAINLVGGTTVDNITITGTCTGAGCGGGSGTVTTTGSPATGNMAKFSGASSITNGDLTGDVTTSGTLATTIAANAVTSGKINAASVTLAKIQNAVANCTLLGAGAAGSGSPYVEMTMGTNLSCSGTTLNVSGTAGQVTPAYVAKTGTYTAVWGTDGIIEGTTNAFTITLPTAVGHSGSGFALLNYQTANTVTIAATGGQTFTGPSLTAASTVGILNGAMLIMSDGANWKIEATAGLPCGTLTSGGIPYFNSTASCLSSALLTASALMVGGGAGTAPAVLGSLGTTTTVLHGNASGLPTWSAVSLANDITGTLGVGSGGTGQTSFTDGQLLIGNTTGNTLAAATLTAGSNITITNGHGTITIASSGGGGGTVLPGICQFRLTTESGVPVSTTDRTAQGTIYYTPYNGNHCSTYDSSTWTDHTSAEFSLALTATSGKNYDVFVDWSGSVLELTLSAAWTNDTTRADAIALQDGVQVKSSDHSKKLVGTIRASGTNVTADSGGYTGTSQVGAKRFVWNRYNQVRRPMSVIDTTASWSYINSTVRQADAAAGNKVEYVAGDVLTDVSATIQAIVRLSSNGVITAVGVGVDSTTAYSGVQAGCYDVAAGTNFCAITASYVGSPGLGYHAINWNENGDGSGFTVTFQGLNGTNQSGLVATIWN